MWEYSIDKSDGTVVFGQLLGMCDHVTFTLGNTFPLSVRLGYLHAHLAIYLYTHIACMHRPGRLSCL